MNLQTNLGELGLSQRPNQTAIYFFVSTRPEQLGYEIGTPKQPDTQDFQAQVLKYPYFIPEQQLEPVAVAALADQHAIRKPATTATSHKLNLICYLIYDPFHMYNFHIQRQNMGRKSRLPVFNLSIILLLLPQSQSQHVSISS